MNLDARIECEEPRLCNRRDLRSVLHFDEKKPRALTIVVREINGLGLQIRKDGLDSCAGFSCFRRCIPGLDRDTHLYEKSHKSPSDKCFNFVASNAVG